VIVTCLVAVASSGAKEDETNLCSIAVDGDESWFMFRSAVLTSDSEDCRVEAVEMVPFLLLVGELCGSSSPPRRGPGRRRPAAPSPCRRPQDSPATAASPHTTQH
jgi:hypothetical protein